ncbi:MAG: type II secretion system GspH family protein [Planctomycetota bacterium]|nr:type II secretion system GspH family protein [Planctomycetota bacterium]
MVLRRSASGFTLFELLVAVAIVVLLAGVLLPALRRFQIEGHTVASQTMLGNFKKGLVAYRAQERGTYPIRPEGSGDVWSGAPGYYQVEAAPLGSPSAGRERNRDLVKALMETGHFSAGSAHWRSGKLVDDFGNPVIVRFLVLPPPAAHPDGELREIVLIYTYGPNGINETDVTPEYANRGAPDYDLDEFRRVRDASDYGDDIVQWVNP